MKQQVLAAVILCLLGALFGSDAAARTWYVTVDGLGDAPTIRAAVDSSAAGDTVLVGPGTYQLLASIQIKSGVAVVSELGPQETIIEPDPFRTVVRAFGLSDNSELRGFWIKPMLTFGLTVPGDGVAISYNIIETRQGHGISINGGVTIENNLIFGGGVGLLTNIANVVIYVSYNIILNGEECDAPGVPFYIARCNDFMGPADCFAQFEGGFSLDPKFCGVAGSGNFFLQSDSPCAPGNHPDGFPCGLIGPLPVGCGTVPIEKKTWGNLKTLYEN